MSEMHGHLFKALNFCIVKFNAEALTDIRIYKNFRSLVHMELCVPNMFARTKLYMHAYGKVYFTTTNV